MISKVMNAPVNTFFDVTPTGTIMNRFSKDLTVMDLNIAFIFGGINVMVYQVAAILIVICTTNWYILAVFPPIIFMGYILFSYTITSYRECTRIESITKSPLLNLLSESLNGSSTIRAFGKQDDFIEQNTEFLNKNVLSNQILMATWCWYGIRMDFVSIILMVSATVICVIYKDSEDKVLLAMVFTYIL
jgi:ATP-binding cassette subfamily C (CFTR/MRP) protein 1